MEANFVLLRLGLQRAAVARVSLKKRCARGGLRLAGTVSDGVDCVPIGRRIVADGIVVQSGIVSPQGRWALRCLVYAQRRRTFLFQTEGFEFPHIAKTISDADQTAAPLRFWPIGTMVAKLPESQPLVVLVLVERVQVFRIVVDRARTGRPARCAVLVGHLRHR